MTIVEVENLSKKYLIAHEHQNPYASLKEILAGFVKRSARRLIGKAPLNKNERLEEFWALRDLNLQIQQGDRIAILGRNGAGKSTFLKLLSRITEPTTGRIKIKGRVSSLLEVGTGFHPDLTGRENIFLNGAIMGMTYKEIKKKFDQIVQFSEVEKFLDTPIKRYSSGMIMRLGFAVAAYLDSDLFIVDEGLAVGDAQFQERCLQKMNEMGTQGSTVLFVSHSITNVLSLCNKGIFLEKGELKAFEPVDQCISRYVKSCPVSGLSWTGDKGDDHIRLYKVALKAPCSDQQFYYQGEKTSLDIDFDITQPHPDLTLGFSVLNSRQHLIARSRLCDYEELKKLVTCRGSHQVSFHLDLDLFHPGEYQIRIDCSLFNRKKILQDDVVLKFAVCSQNTNTRQEIGSEKDGISLGSRWAVKPSEKILVTAS